LRAGGSGKSGIARGECCEGIVRCSWGEEVVSGSRGSAVRDESKETEPLLCEAVSCLSVILTKVGDLTTEELPIEVFLTAGG